MVTSARVPEVIRKAGWRALDRTVRPFRGKGLATRFPVLWRLHSKVRRGLGVQIVHVLGHDIEVDKDDTLHIAANGRYEVVEGDWYAANVAAGDFVVEVGANIGFFTLLFARQVGPEGAVLAFEPDPEIAAILRRNVARNGYSNVVVRDVAVGEVAETRDLFRSSTNRGDNHFFQTSGDAESVAVQVCTLDDELRAFDRRVDLLKIDIQGAEPLAIAGARKTFAENPPRRILMEFWPTGLAANGFDPSQVLTTLRTAGYHIGELTDTGVIDIEESALLTRLAPGTDLWVNLVCVHERD